MKAPKFLHKLSNASQEVAQLSEIVKHCPIINSTLYCSNHDEGRRILAAIAIGYLSHIGATLLLEEVKS